MLLLRTMLLAGIAVASGLSVAQGAIMINLGSNLQTFDSLPNASDWSAGNITGAATDVNDAAGLDAAVLPRTAAGINTTLVTQTNFTTNSTGSLSAHWNSSSPSIYTKPSGNIALLLMATLQNNAGATVNQLKIDWDLGVNISDGAATEQIAGHRLYYSTTGAASSWTAVGNFGYPISPTPVSPQAQTTTLTGLTWTAGSTLYLLWADDNQTPGADSAYILDNVNFIASAVPEPSAWLLGTVGMAGLVAIHASRRKRISGKEAIAS